MKLGGDMRHGPISSYQVMYDRIEVKHILEGCNAHRYDQIYY